MIKYILNNEESQQKLKLLWKFYSGKEFDTFTVVNINQLEDDYFSFKFRMKENLKDTSWDRRLKIAHLFSKEMEELKRNVLQYFNLDITFEPDSKTEDILQTLKEIKDVANAILKISSEMDNHDFQYRD